MTAHLRRAFRLMLSFNGLRHNVHFAYCQSIKGIFYTCQSFSDLKIKYILNGVGIKAADDISAGR